MVGVPDLKPGDPEEKSRSYHELELSQFQLLGYACTQTTGPPPVVQDS